MLPISEVHFAFCGIATVAATLGYACARRAVLSLASTDEHSKADVEARPYEERSLKRKLDHSDEHDADTEEQSRPMKRNRTPPIYQHESDDEWEVIVAPPPYEHLAGIQQPQEPVCDMSTPPQSECHTIQHNITPAREPTPPVHRKTSPQPDEKGAEAGCCATPRPSQADLSPNEPLPATPVKPTAPTTLTSANAFSAFSGSSSPFASYFNTSGVSPLAISGQIVRTVPAWRSDNENELDMSSRASAANALAPSPNDATPSATKQSPVLSQSETVPREMQSLTKSSSCLTGEEDEAIEAELKGVKLFVKRGRKEFTDGMYGHIKLLAKKPMSQKSGSEDSLKTEAEANSRTRLLFRRDPLGQVSMNVGLHPTVTTDGKDSKEDIVIYALRPGRAQKADFQSFAKTLCDHEGLQSRVVTTTPTSGAVTS